MSTKDISNRVVLDAVNQCKLANYECGFPYQLLAQWTGQPEKVCFRAMERAIKYGLLEYGVSIRTAWLTEKGKELLSKGDL